MLTVSSPSVRLERLFLQLYHQLRTMDSSVSRTGCHAVRQISMSGLVVNGTSLMEQLFHHKTVLRHSIQTEVMMEQSI